MLNTKEGADPNPNEIKQKKIIEFNYVTNSNKGNKYNNRNVHSEQKVNWDLVEGLK